MTNSEILRQVIAITHLDKMKEIEKRNSAIEGLRLMINQAHSSVSSSAGLEGPLSYEYKPDKFEKFVLDYTASTTWEQIRDMDWTTAEMLDLVKKYMDKNKAA